jgi:hypothetical protein
MPTPEQMLQDPEFTKLPIADRRLIFTKADPSFAQLPENDQTAVLSRAEEKVKSIAGPGFAGSALNALNPMPALTSAFNAAFRTSPSAAYDLIRPQVEQFQKAGQQLKQVGQGGKYLAPLAGAAMYGSAGALPGYGPAITRAVEQERAGNPTGGLGTLAGTAAIPVMGEGFSRVAGKVTGKPIYESVVKPSKDLPQPVREAVVARGRRLQTEASQEGMKEAQGRIDVNKGVVKRHTGEGTEGGERTIPNSEVLKDLDKEIKVHKGSNDPRSAEPLMELRKQWTEKHGDENSFTTVAEQQRLKQNTDRVLNRKVHAEGAQPSGSPLGNKLIAQGQRKAIATEVPEVKVPNRAQYLDINLKNAINEAIKRDPNWLDHWGRRIVAGEGIAAGTALATGHPILAGAAAGTGLVTMMLRKATSDPAAMTRLSFALDNAGVKLPPAVRAAALGGPAATLGSATRRIELPDLPPSQLPGAQQ